MSGVLDCPCRLRVRIGQNEFEASGIARLVQAQFAAFRAILLNEFKREVDSARGYVQWWLIVEAGDKKIIWQRYSQASTAIEECERLREAMFYGPPPAGTFVNLAG